MRMRLSSTSNYAEKAHIPRLPSWIQRKQVKMRKGEGMVGMKRDGERKQINEKREGTMRREI